MPQIANEVVTFRQLSLDDANHRDAEEFRTGLKIRLQELDEGQCFEVQALSTEETALRNEIDVPSCSSREVSYLPLLPDPNVFAERSTTEFPAGRLSPLTIGESSS